MKNVVVCKVPDFKLFNNTKQVIDKYIKQQKYQ